jgi:hypothetical protein
MAKTRCTARTLTTGKRCGMQAVYGESLCRAHHPQHRDAWVESNRRRTKAYWQRKRAEKPEGNRLPALASHQPQGEF